MEMKTVNFPFLPILGQFLTAFLFSVVQFSFKVEFKTTQIAVLYSNIFYKLSAVLIGEIVVRKNIEVV
jgi:hypothetical protein